MLKKVAIVVFLFSILLNCYSQQISNEKVITAIENSTIDDAISTLKTILKDPKIITDECAEVYFALAQLLEQQGNFLEACQYYTNASALEGTHTINGQNLLLNAVRCSLFVADVLRADFLLSTGIPEPQNNEIRSRANMYAVWSWLLKIQTQEELLGPISVLETYVTLDTMIEFRPTILLVLNNYTENPRWKSQLLRDFPLSPEATLVNGETSIAPSPFWCFNYSVLK